MAAIARKIRVLIIDDSSKDRTFATGLQHEDRSGDFRLTILRNPENQGYGGNQKLGYRYAIENGFDEIVVKTKNRFYEMRSALAQLQFDVIRFVSHPVDNGESKVYLSKKLDASVLKSHRLTRTVVQA